MNKLALFFTVFSASIIQAEVVRSLPKATHMIIPKSAFIASTDLESEYRQTYSITSPGNYVLAQSITSNVPSGTTAAIYINSSDVVLDLGNHTITLGSNAGATTSGILCADGKSNITIQNGSINGDSNGDYGIDIGSCSNVKIEDINIVNTVDHAIEGTTGTGITIKNSTITNGSANGINITDGVTGSSEISVENVKISSGTNGLVLGSPIGVSYNIHMKNVHVGKVGTGATSYGCLIQNFRGGFIENCNFTSVVSSGDFAAFGLYIVGTHGLTIKNCESNSHTSVGTADTAHAIGYYLSSSIGCVFTDCRSTKCDNADVAGAAAGFYLLTSDACEFYNCTSSGHNGARNAYGYYQTDSDGNFYNGCKAIRCYVDTDSATNIAAGFYAVDGEGNTFISCESHNNYSFSDTTASTDLYGAGGFILDGEIQDRLEKCVASGNGGTTSDQQSNSYGFLLSDLTTADCKYSSLRDCQAIGNCSNTDAAAWGFRDASTDSRNLLIECVSASNVGETTNTNYAMDLPISGTDANVYRVEASLDGLLDVANKPPLFSISLTA